MDRMTGVLKAVSDALSVPLYPAPARGIFPCAVYRYFPSESDGSAACSRLEVRVIAPLPAQAVREMTALRRALTSDGDEGVLEDGSGTLLVCQTEEGSGSGFLRGCGLYYVKAGFQIRGRA